MDIIRYARVISDLLNAQSMKSICYTLILLPLKNVFIFAKDMNVILSHPYVP